MITRRPKGAHARTRQAARQAARAGRWLPSEPTPPNDPVRTPYDVWCPTCHAATGIACNKANDGYEPAKRAHKARAQAAREAASDE